MFGSSWGLFGYSSGGFEIAITRYSHVLSPKKDMYCPCAGKVESSRAAKVIAKAKRPCFLSLCVIISISLKMGQKDLSFYPFRATSPDPARSDKQNPKIWRCKVTEYCLHFHKLPHHHAVLIAETDHIEALGEVRNVDGDTML